MEKQTLTPAFHGVRWFTAVTGCSGRRAVLRVLGIPANSDEQCGPPLLPAYLPHSHAPTATISALLRIPDFNGPTSFLFL
jgi:hypothetical protein